MSYNSIPSTWREIGKAIKKDLIDAIHDNLEDLNGRLINTESSISTTIIANEKVQKERDNQALGTIVWSPLSLAQFQAEVADGEWYLCDGQSVAGTDYGTLMSRANAPDLRGRFLRMKDHAAGRNPDGDVATDTTQDSDNKTHLHTINHGHSHTIAATGTFASSTHKHNIGHAHQWAYRLGGTGTAGIYSLSSANSAQNTFTNSGTTQYVAISDTSLTVQTSGAGSTALTAQVGIFTTSAAMYTSGALDAVGGGAASTAVSGEPTATSSPGTTGSVTSHSGNSGSTGLAESRPQNITENAFIKVNRNYITTRTGYFLWRAPQALTINQVIISPVEQGTSGTLTIDIMKGDVTTQSTSIFSVLPTVDSTDTTAQTGTLDPTNAIVDAGDYIRVDVTTTQAKLKQFHILVAASPT